VFAIVQARAPSPLGHLWTRTILLPRKTPAVLAAQTS
jgi:hypothetical protein